VPRRGMQPSGGCSGFISYDAAGNLLSDGVNAYTYDAENRLTTVKVNGSLTGTYVYDALGQRVEKITPSGVPSDCDTNGGTVFYIRGLSGHTAVYTSQSVNQCHDYIYAGGRHLVTYKGYAEFTHADWLGTERVRGSQTCTSNPFGDALACSPANTGQYRAHTHFTGKERDSESGLDNFGARFNSFNIGRFMSPDAKFPTMRHVANSQKWNRYAYVHNNLLAFIDPDGLDDWFIFRPSIGKNSAGTGN